MIHREIFHLANIVYLCAGPKIHMAVSGQRVVMLDMLLKGTVQRYLRGVKSGINR